jgi:hypothetical protein
MPTIQEELEAIAYKFAYGVIESVLVARGGVHPEVERLRQENAKLASDNALLQQTVQDLTKTGPVLPTVAPAIVAAWESGVPADDSKWRPRDKRRNGTVKRVVGLDGNGKVLLRPTTDTTGPLSRVKLERFHRDYMPYEGA